MRTSSWIVVGLLPIVMTACPKKDEPQSEAFTVGEAQQALEESALSDQATSVTSGTIEIATNFTIGQAVEAAAEELRQFITSQLPCAELTLSKATLSIEYGANPGNCTYNGHTYSGMHTLKVSSNDEGSVVVDHTWDKLSNQRIEVSGTAQVTWSSVDKSRHVVHTLHWKRLSDGRQAQGTGDRTQTVLEGGILEGIKVDGTRTWKGEAGEWNLAISNVEMRWVDPVPQAGGYTLAAPSGKSLSMSFDRVDEDTIKVTVSSASRSFSFRVSKLGAIASQ